MKEPKISPPMVLKLKTLSPLHIGTGEVLQPLEYAVDGQYFYKVPQSLFNRFLDQQGDQAKRKFAQWVTHKFEEIIDLEQGARLAKDYSQKRDFNQQLSYLNNQTNTLEFSANELDKRQDFLQFLQKEAVIRSKIDPRQIDRKGLRGQVREAIKGGDNRPYLPGSTLKGSLRSALLYHWLSNHANPVWIEDKIRDQIKKVRSDIRQDKRKLRRAMGQFGDALEAKAFYCESHRGRKRVDDELMDLMKLVSFSDAHLQIEEDQHVMELIDIKIYLLERKPSRSRDKKVEVRAVAQSQTSFAEAIPSQRELHTTIDFNIDFLLAWKEKFTDGKGYVQVDKDQFWKDIEKKVKQLFQLDIKDLNQDNKAAKKQEVLQHLIQCLQDFSHAQLQRNEVWQENFEEFDGPQYMSKDMRRGLRPIKGVQSQNGRLLHLGYGTGFLGMTAVLYFLEGQQTLQDVYTEVMNLFKLGNEPRNKGVYKANITRFPKSRRMASGNRVIAPLGWLQVYLKDEKVEFQEADHSIEAPNSQQEETAAPIKREPPKATYYTGKINHRKIVELDAVVVKSGRPNRVEVYIREGEEHPIMTLNGYRNPIEVGKIIIVKCDFSKKGKLVQLSFGGFKK